MPPTLGLPVGPCPAFGIIKHGKVDDTVARATFGDGVRV